MTDDIRRVFNGLRRWSLVLYRERLTDFHGWEFDEAGGGFLVGEQRRDFAAKILVFAFTFQKREAVVLRVSSAAS